MGLEESIETAWQDAEHCPKEQLARDVRASLSGREPSLPCKYLYDNRGSQLFEQITQLPEYYLTRAEVSLLKSQGRSLIERIRPAELTEIGSGAGIKIRLLLDALCAVGTGRACTLFDINERFVRLSLGRLREAYPQLSFRGVTGEFPRHLDRLGARTDRLGLLLGSTLGNQEYAMVPDFLRHISRTLLTGSHFLIGLDTLKDPERIEAAYNDRDGVTARFNKNVLNVLNRELDADFDPTAFTHVAEFDEERALVDIRLRSDREQRVNLPVAGISLDLSEGQEIRTEISCKYTRESFSGLVHDTGLQLSDWVTDESGDFALALLVKQPEQAMRLDEGRGVSDASREGRQP